MISGALCFYAKKHVVYWHGSSLEKYLNLRPVNLVMYEIVKDSCEQGYSWFDFDTSGGLPGVIAFKKSFGAKPLDCY
ncbi:MAG: GNAT family N-acetyltransferase, partial [Moorea sp. SIO2I5]|nr:GNAT family N-acetyltransferase [Moorena sp. SIO2I5]